MSDVRGKWPGKELVGMNFVGSAKAGRESNIRDKSDCANAAGYGLIDGVVMVCFQM